MIKRAALDKLFNSNVIPLLSNVFEKEGFTYSKTKRKYTRRSGDFFHEIALGQVKMTLGPDGLYYQFKMYMRVSIPPFNDWCITNLEQESHFKFETFENNRHTYVVAFKDEDIQDQDIYSPSPAMRFKGAVLSEFSHGRQNDKIITLSSENNTEVLNHLLQYLATVSDYEFLLSQDISHLWPYAYLCFYMGKNEKGTACLKKFVEWKVIQNNEIRQSNPQRILDSIKSDNNILKHTGKYVTEKIENPFAQELEEIASKQELPVLPNQKEILAFTEEIQYEEFLRYDTRLKRVRAFSVNHNGEMILYTGDEILWFDSMGTEKVRTEADSYDFNWSLDFTTFYLGIPNTEYFHYRGKVFQTGGEIIVLEKPADYLNGLTLDVFFDDTEQKYYQLIYRLKPMESTWLLTMSTEN